MSTNQQEPANGDATDAGDADRVVKVHYERLATNYDHFLHYSADFVRWHTSAMIEHLALTPDDVLVDLGGGTGMYSLDIVEQVPLTNPVVIVDPFPQMLEQIPDGAPVERVAEDALAFSEQPRQYDKVLIKEAVHHVQERERLFRNLYERLRPGGRVLLVHVPPELDYPLFQAALERSLTWHANPDELEPALRRVGFGVERERRVYRHRMPTEHYLRMVESQYMSLLSSFSDDELARGLDEMRRAYGDRDLLEFDDRFDYLTAVKPT